MADTGGALQPYSRGQRSSVRAVYGVLKKRLPIPHLGWAASDICPNARVSSQPVLCKITRVSATMLTYLGAICKPNRMHLKWEEMPKMKHKWWSPGLACTWPLCGLSARPPPLSGAFGKPITHQGRAQSHNPPCIPFHCSTRAGGLAPNCEATSLAEGARPQREGAALKTKPALRLQDVFNPLLKLPIREAIRANCGCMLQYKNPSHTGNLHTYLALLVPW